MTLVKVGLAVVLSVLFLSDHATAGTTIKVSLWDKGMGSMDMMDQMKPMGMAMMGADMTMVTMGITLDQTTVAAGEVTFEAQNVSKDIIHEMILAPVADQTKALPYLVDENRVDEELAGHLGEVSELDPGKSGALTVTLKPGSYILFCNIPGHYAMGMWTVLTVTE
jgi:uncharacterized cupredoxin-like copper-binding protein